MLVMDEQMRTSNREVKPNKEQDINVELKSTMTKIFLKIKRFEIELYTENYKILLKNKSHIHTHTHTHTYTHTYTHI
jgi:hypothetical protein